MTDLRGRVASITGGASGIGLGIAGVLAKHGVRLVLAEIDAEQLEAARPTVAADTMLIRLDGTERAAWARARVETEARFGLSTSSSRTPGSDQTAGRSRRCSRIRSTG